LDSLPDDVTEAEAKHCIACGLVRGEGQDAEILIRLYPELAHESDAYEPGTAAWCRAEGGIDITCVGDSRCRFLMPSGRELVSTDLIQLCTPAEAYLRNAIAFYVGDDFLSRYPGKGGE